MGNLLDYATPDERADLMEAQRALREARERTAEHRAALDRARHEANMAAATFSRDAASAAAHYLGEVETAPEVPPVPKRGRAELEAIESGLRVRVGEDERAEKDAERALGEKIATVTKACMERVGPVYLRAALELGGCHAALAAGAELLRLAGVDADALDRDHWNRLCVPGSQRLASLRDHGIVENPTWGTRLLAGGEKHQVYGRSDVAFRALEGAVRSLLGEFPFKSSGPILVGSVSAPRPNASSERRAVLERAVGLPTR